MDELKEYLSTLDNDINPEDWDYIEDYDDFGLFNTEEED